MIRSNGTQGPASSVPPARHPFAAAPNRRAARALVASLLVAIVVTACGGGTASSAPLATASSAPAATASNALGSPDPARAAVTAAWASPASGVTIRTPSVRFSATFTGGVAAKAVAFTARAGAATRTVCSARQAPLRTWSCEADLLALGITPGTVTLGLRITDARGVHEAAADPRQVTYAVPPLPPVGVAVKNTAGAKTTRTVSWKGNPAGATSVAAYGFTPCVAPPTSTGKPCIVNGTRVTSTMILPITSGKADAQSLSWTEDGGNIGGANGVWNGKYYNALLVAAENEYGRSRFVIVSTASSCNGCTH